MSDTLPPKKPRHQQDSASLFVSLYVVLLAFFIMLNTMAKVNQDKMEEAVGSISQAFSMKVTLKNVPEVLKSAGTDMSNLSFFSEMKKVAANFVPVEMLNISTYGNKMEITMPVDFMFEPESEKLKETNISFINNIAKAMTKWQDENRIDVESIIASEKHMDLIERSATDTDMLRAGTVARHLVRNGVDPAYIATGIIDDTRGLMIMRFSVRDPDKSRLEGSGLIKPQSNKQKP